MCAPVVIIFCIVFAQGMIVDVKAVFQMAISTSLVFLKSFILTKILRVALPLEWRYNFQDNLHFTVYLQTNSCSVG